MKKISQDLRIGFVLLILIVFLLGFSIATQWLAAGLHYEPALGKPLFIKYHFYNPFYFLRWDYRYSNITVLKPYFLRSWLIVGVTTVLVLILGSIYYYIEYKNRSNQTTFGSAHFAKKREVMKSVLFNCHDNNAVYVGGWLDPKSQKVYYLRDNSPSNVLVYAPSRSGKGVGLIIPTLLSYEGSVIISDFKLENWQLTAGWRQQNGSIVLKFDPTCSDGSGSSFNPLMEIRKGINEIRDTQLIADMLVNPDGKSSTDHWCNAANSLLVSTILHVLYSEHDKSLTGVRQFLAEPSRTTEAMFEQMLTSTHDPEYHYHWKDPLTGIETNTHPTVASGAKEMMSKSEAERQSIISSALTFLKLYRDPIVAQNIREHDFTIHDIVYHQKPVSLYLGVPPSDISRITPLIRLILQMILARLTESMDFTDQNNKRRQLLLMLDEFPQFGRIPFFEKALGYTAGYNIRAYLICQDIQQIYQEYGREQSIISNCSIRIAYAPNTIETARHLSETLGSQTITKKQINYSGKRFQWLLSQVSLSDQEIKRPLMTPDELMCMDKEAVLIFKNGLAPIYGKKIVYYNDKIFLQRVSMKISLDSITFYIRENQSYTKILDKCEKNIKQFKINENFLDNFWRGVEKKSL